MLTSENVTVISFSDLCFVLVISLWEIMRRVDNFFGYFRPVFVYKTTNIDELRFFFVVETNISQNTTNGPSASFSVFLSLYVFKETKNHNSITPEAIWIKLGRRFSLVNIDLRKRILDFNYYPFKNGYHERTYFRYFYENLEVFFLWLCFVLQL